ncbi:MAG TPA: hypothetical protein VHW24_13690 [Bryobacteraceae bacterium]|jgi:hypothetical protein|nr:hypothetical protein [Bryobacteraceae bacterium]
MKLSQAIANCLLDRGGLDVGLRGDLLEERARGRSALWYWRQVAVAILAGVWSGARDHKVDVLRVLTMGFALEYLVILIWSIYGFRVPYLSTEQWAIQSLGVLILGVLIGWLIADREQPLPTVIMFVICESLWFLGHDLSWVKLLVASVDRPMFRPDIVEFFMAFVLQNVGLVIGGMLVRQRKEA